VYRANGLISDAPPACFLRVAFSCFADQSGISEKPICRRVRRTLMIRIASTSPLFLNVYATMSTCPPADRPSRRKRHSADECCGPGHWEPRNPGRHRDLRGLAEGHVAGRRRREERWWGFDVRQHARAESISKRPFRTPHGYNRV